MQSILSYGSSILITSLGSCPRHSICLTSSGNPEALAEIGTYTPVWGRCHPQRWHRFSSNQTPPKYLRPRVCLRFLGSKPKLDVCVFVSDSPHSKGCLTPGLCQPWTTGRDRRPSAGRGSMLALGSLLGPLPWACVSDSISVQDGSWHSGLGDRKLNWGLNYKRQSLYDHRRLRTGRELRAYFVYNNSELGFIEHLLYGRHCTK